MTSAEAHIADHHVILVSQLLAAISHRAGVQVEGIAGNPAEVAFGVALFILNSEASVGLAATLVFCLGVAHITKRPLGLGTLAGVVVADLSKRAEVVPGAGARLALAVHTLLKSRTIVVVLAPGDTHLGVFVAVRARLGTITAAEATPRHFAQPVGALGALGAVPVGGARRLADAVVADLLVGAGALGASGHALESGSALLA